MPTFPFCVLQRTFCSFEKFVNGVIHRLFDFQCSAPCGKGQQSRAVFCGRKGGHTLTSSHCSQSKKPSSTRSCNSGKCHAKWVTTEWSEVTRMIESILTRSRLANSGICVS